MNGAHRRTITSRQLVAGSIAIGTLATTGLVCIGVGLRSRERVEPALTTAAGEPPVMLPMAFRSSASAAVSPATAVRSPSARPAATATRTPAARPAPTAVRPVATAAPTRRPIAATRPPVAPPARTQPPVPATTARQTPRPPAPAPARIAAKPSSTVTRARPAAAPVSLRIPAIGVRTPLIQLGLTRKQAMQVPAGSNYDKAGWYRYSPTPGSIGPAVIAGHVDSKARGPSVFYKLGRLRRGDKVHVTRADGSVAVFTVDDVRRYPKAAFPTRIVYGDTDHAALRLITCGGPFARGHYLHNIVVTASLTSTR